MAFGTMTGQAFFVLTTLADGPRHGYGIVGEVAELSHGRERLKIGSPYGARVARVARAKPGLPGAEAAGAGR
jgi:hypothetical protein